MEHAFEKIAIIGVGLIGGSLGMATIGRDLAKTVVGVDNNIDALIMAKDTKAIHEGTTLISEGVKDADLVIIATPVGLTIDLLNKCIPYLKKGCIITDVGSTKENIVNKAEEILLGQELYFVGGHPMAGSEKAGIMGADRYLFENAVYILTPTKNTNCLAVEKFSKYIQGLGARVISLDPGEHDLMVGAVSHLPHIIASALVNTAGNINKQYDKTLMLAAGGFRDTTRIAAGHPVMWRDICIANRNKIIIAIQEFRQALDELENQIIQGNADSLQKQFEDAKEIRLSIPAKMKGYLPSLHEIVVTVPDEPGIIANIASILGEKQINITDIEILRVREGEGGTIRLGFAEENQAEEAVKVLLDKEIIAKRR